jgi:plasmid stabilization system protein ParE
MKRYRIRPTKSAVDDAEEIMEWLLRENADAAYRWYQGLFTAFDSLRSNPKRCSRAPEAEVFEAEVRHFFYGMYRIIFEITSDSVYIIHVRHAARRPIGD